MLSDVVIRATVDRLRAERIERLKIDKDDLVRRMVLSYTYDTAAFFDDDNRLKPLSELHPDYRCLVEGMDVSEKVTGEEGDGISRLMKVKLPRRLDAMKLMVDHLQKHEDTDLKPQRAIRIIKAEEMTIAK